MAKSVYAASGSQALLRKRSVQQLIDDQRKAGWRIDRVDASVKGQLRAALSQGGIFSDSKVLVVVYHPEKADLSIYEDHLAVKDPDVVLLLNCDGEVKKNTKFGKFLQRLGKAHQSFSPSARKWEAEEAAIQFCQKEVDERYGKVLSESLARALVNRLGADYGILSFELWKMSLLADLESSEEITAEHAKRMMAAIQEVDAYSLVDAVAFRSVQSVVKCLRRIKSTSKGDPTMGICRLLGRQAVQWYVMVQLRNEVSTDVMAKRMGMNSWFLKNKLLPKINRWNSLKVRRLLKALAESERSVLQGHVDPWSGFSARLIDSCQ